MTCLQLSLLSSFQMYENSRKLTADAEDEKSVAENPGNVAKDAATGGESLFVYAVGELDRKRRVEDHK